MNNIEILEEFIKYFEAEATQRKYRRNISITVGEDDIEAIENLIQENTELKEYKKIAELTKISCCTAQNCEALNNAIKNGLENEKLLQENKELKKLENLTNESIKNSNSIKKNYIPKSKVKELNEKIHNLLDDNGITRAYQLEIDKYFEDLEEGE